jgi:hypothetical protein
MRLYQVKSENKVRYVAAHNPHQAGQISKFKKITTVEEINISEPVLLLEICQESTQTEKSDSTSGK